MHENCESTPQSNSIPARKCQSSGHATYSVWRWSRWSGKWAIWVALTMFYWHRLVDIMFLENMVTMLIMMLTMMMMMSRTLGNKSVSCPATPPPKPTQLPPLQQPLHYYITPLQSSVDVRAGYRGKVAKKVWLADCSAPMHCFLLFSASQLSWAVMTKACKH